MMRAMVRGARGGVPQRRAGGVGSVRCAAATPQRPASRYTGEEIRLIVTDVDGTLLNSSHELTDATEAAITRAADLGVPVVVATGKTKGPWSEGILPRIQTDMPGLYLQGLVIHNADGSLRWEKTMEPEVCLAAIAFAEERNLDLVAYCGDRILCRETSAQTDRLLPYGEPPPEAVGSLAGVVGEIPIHKMIFLCTQEALEEMRPSAQELFENMKADLITALPGMLEVLPEDGGKAASLERLLEELGVSPKNVMALGDGENDAEMLRMAGVGVAMGNAGPHALETADFVVSSNDEGGWGEAIDHFVVRPRTEGA